MNIEKLTNYARLIARTGVNIQKGQEVFVTGSVEIKDFVRIVVKECYLAGASRVFVDYTDDAIDKLTIEYGDEEKLSHLNEMERAKQEHFVKNWPCRIFITSEDPDGLKGVDVKKHGRITTSKSKEVWEYRKIWDNECQWVIAGYPSKAWARKVFPGTDEDEAVEKLLDLILKTSRADQGDPIENWKIHDDNLRRHTDKLNSLDIDSLHYTSSKGTNLTIGLCKGVKFLAGGEKTKTEGIFFQPNIPTEEVFTSPDKYRTEGIVYSTKPLSLRGTLVENFNITFKEGRIVEVHAEKGEDVLKDAIFNSEDGDYLGECAIVPVDSPINQTDTLFFNTLYDENASCHLAFGKAFKNLIEGYENMTEEEIESYPLNNSTTHVDFMIGDETLTIVATTRKGEKVTILKDGRWAI